MKVRRAFIFFLILLLLSSGCTTRVPDYASYPYAGTQAGTMSWDVEGAVVKPLPVWTYNGKDVFSEWYYRQGNCNVSGDVVYTSGDRLTTLDLKTGKELWETQLKNSAPNENTLTYILFPTIYKDKIVAIGARLVVEKGSEYYRERRNVLVFDRVTGKLLWKSVDIGSIHEYFNQGYPVILNNKIYVPALNGEYRAEFGFQNIARKEEERGIWVWDLNTGKLLDKIFFSFPEGELCLSITNVISDGENLYVMAGVTPSVEKTNRTLGPQYLIAFNPRDRKVLWQIQALDDMSGATEFNSFGMNSKVIVVSRSVAPTATHGVDHWIRAYDKKTGKILWSKPTIKVWVDAVDISLTEDRLFAQVTDNSLSCFDPLTGKEIWTYKCSHKPPSAEFFTVGVAFCPFLTKNVLYLRSIDMIIALDPNAGQELWSIVPPFSKIINDDENSMGNWMLIPVDNGFVTFYADFGMGSDAMLSPPIVQLWSVANNKK